MGAGLDLITARELALKIAEGARVPTGALHLESLLHGHLAGEDASTAVVLVESDPAPTGSSAAPRLAAAALGAIGMPVLTCSRRSAPPYGCLELRCAALLRRAPPSRSRAHAARSGRRSRLRGVNPDLIRREERGRYRGLCGTARARPTARGDSA